MNPIPSDPDFINNLRILRNLKKPFWIPVSGGSMRPQLDSNDFVRIIPRNFIPGNALLPGMIVLVGRNSHHEVVLHRLVGVGARWLFERGDKARIVRAFKLDDLLGYATHRRRAGKTKRLNIPIAWRLRRLLSRLRIGG